VKLNDDDTDLTTDQTDHARPCVQSKHPPAETAPLFPVKRRSRTAGFSRPFWSRDSERAFSRAGPATWNALPDHIRTVPDPAKFRTLLLKSHYFSQAFNIC